MCFTVSLQRVLRVLVGVSACAHAHCVHKFVSLFMFMHSQYKVEHGFLNTATHNLVCDQAFFFFFFFSYSCHTNARTHINTRTTHHNTSHTHTDRPPPFAGCLSLRTALTLFADVLSTPHKDVLSTLSTFASDEEQVCVCMC